MTLAEKIKKLRSDNNYTCDDLEEMAELPRSYICGLENGYYRKPHKNKLERLAAVFDVPIDYLKDDILHVSQEEVMNKINMLSDEDKERVYQIVDLFLESTND